MSNIKKLFKYLLNLDFYTSPLDFFLEKFRKEHPNLSKSQRLEKEKYADIFHQADANKASEAQHVKIWNKF